jgi:hypothetical protein
VTKFVITVTKKVTFEIFVGTFMSDLVAKVGLTVMVVVIIEVRVRVRVMVEIVE